MCASARTTRHNLIYVLDHGGHPGTPILMWSRPGSRIVVHCVCHAETFWAPGDKNHIPLETYFIFGDSVRQKMEGFVPDKFSIMLKIFKLEIFTLNPLWTILYRFRIVKNYEQFLKIFIVLVILSRKIWNFTRQFGEFGNVQTSTYFKNFQRSEDL